MKKWFLLFALFQLPNATHPSYGYAPFVDAIQITVPASEPCNLSGTSGSCITGPEERWTCADKKRVLLTSEDGKHVCMKVQFD